MKTGEGKTLVATLPAYLNALEGKGVHVVTVNDYLARRDSEWMGRIYRFLGMTRRRHPARAHRRRAPGRLRRGHHLRHEQRVRLRLPPRQHEVRARALRAARAPLRDRRRGGQHPHRRGADAAHHLGSRRSSRPTCTTKSIASSRSSRRARSSAAMPRPRNAKRSRPPATTSSTRSTRRSRSPRAGWPRPNRCSSTG